MLSSNSFGEHSRKPKGKIMSYVVLKGTVIGGKIVRVGDVVECSDKEAAELIAIGRICKTEKTVVETVDRSVGLSEETKPKRRVRKRKSD